MPQIYLKLPRKVFNRPSVAGAGCSTNTFVTDSLINKLSDPLWKFLQNIVSPKPNELGTWYFERIFTTPYVSHVICYLMSHKCSGLEPWIVPPFCSGLSPRRALKTWRCSWLEPWIGPAFCSESFPRRALKQGGVPDWTLDCQLVLFRIVPAWSLKNGEMFRIGYVDRPRVLFPIVPAKGLKNEEVFRIEPTFFDNFFDTMLLYANVEKVSVSRMQHFKYLTTFCWA